MNKVKKLVKRIIFIVFLISVFFITVYSILWFVNYSKVEKVAQTFGLVQDIENKSEYEAKKDDMNYKIYLPKYPYFSYCCDCWQGNVNEDINIIELTVENKNTLTGKKEKSYRLTIAPEKAVLSERSNDMVYTAYNYLLDSGFNVTSVTSIDYTDENAIKFYNDSHSDVEKVINKAVQFFGEDLIK